MNDALRDAEIQRRQGFINSIDGFAIINLRYRSNNHYLVKLPSGAVRLVDSGEWAEISARQTVEGWADDEAEMSVVSQRVLP